MSLVSIEDALADLRAGRMVVVVDDEGRENEGDLVMAAEMVTPEAINFMARHGRGLICVALTGDRLDELGLPLMAPDNTALHGTAFTVSVDVQMPGVHTGISAFDRAATISALCSPQATPLDFARPGHVFPLRARDGGVLTRPGHTEATVDLARGAALFPGGVLCEILHDDGTMARVPQLEAFAEAHGLRMVSIADLAAYRWRSERLVKRVAEAALPAQHGVFRVFAYESPVAGWEYLAVVVGDVSDAEGVLVRVHSQCLTGDVFGSLRCDCGDQLEAALDTITRAGRGVVVYASDHEGRGIGLGQKIKAYALQDRGLDTVEANLELGFPPDLRHYGLAAQILRDLGVASVRLMTNNPAKQVALVDLGIPVIERVPVQLPPTPENVVYLQTKREKLGHLLHTLDGRISPLLAAPGRSLESGDPDIGMAPFLELGGL